MNWQNYKFFTIHFYDKIYHHFFWIDGYVFSFSLENRFIEIFEEKFKLFEIIDNFLLEKECINYMNLPIENWNIINVGINITYSDISKYIKLYQKIMNRETNLEKILNSI